MKKIIVLSIVLLLIQNVNVTASTNVSGFISVNTTWTTAGSPYIVIGNALLSHGYTLTIDPGVVVKFSDSTALQIDGELHAMGSESQHIIFTSNQTSPAAGDWAEIHFADTCTDAVFDVSGNYLSGCIMEYCDVLYGGILHKGEIHIEDASPYISHCRISNSFSHGIYSNNCSYVFEQSVVKNNNNYGLYFLNYCSMNIIGDSIENNTSGGINFYMPKNYNQYTNIKNNYFYGNNGNGAVYGYMNLFNAVISENQFINNAGSAVISGVNSGLVHCIIQCNKFINNSALYCIYRPNGGTITITNNTFNGNEKISYLYDGGDTTNFTNNIIHNNSSSSGNGCHFIYSSGSPGIFKFENNDFRNNTYANVIYLFGGGVLNLTPTFKNNNFIDPLSNYEIYNDVPFGLPDIYADSNYWGGTSTAHVDSIVFDYFDFADVSVVYYAPILTAPIIVDTTCQTNIWAGFSELNSNKIEQITLFPNPTSSSFTITSTDKIESVKLYNVLGEVVWQNKYNNVTNATIDFTGNISSPSGRSGGAAGIYFVEINTEKGIVRKKIIKE